MDTEYARISIMRSVLVTGQKEAGGTGVVIDEKKKVPGYGDPEYYRCPVPTSSGPKQSLCSGAVRFTYLQIDLAKAGLLGAAGEAEWQQNRRAIQLGCRPAFNRI